MKTSISRITTLSLLTAANASSFSSASHIQSSLKSWPSAAAKSLSRMIARNANQSAFAVFDADNTIWRYDISESSLPYLENRGIITRSTLDPALHLIDFKDTANYTETLYSYYNRLCEIDNFVCYPWAAQVYSGLSLRELKGYIDELMAYNGTIPTSYWDEDVVVREEINPARPFAGQKELINTLMANGIDVWIVSASNEEVVRMVVSDPKYGYNIKPENVLGVAIMMKNTTSGDLTASRKQIADGMYNQTANLNLVLGSYLWTPATWYAGKWAAILTYIDMWKKPILAAGDTPGSDTYMHFNVDVEKGGVHLWINKSASNWEALQGLIKTNTEGQRENGLRVTADKNWVVVLPTDIGPGLAI